MCYPISYIIKLLQKNEKRNNLGVFSDLVLFVVLFFRKFDKTSQNVTIGRVTIIG